MPEEDAIVPEENEDSPPPVKPKSTPAPVPYERFQQVVQQRNTFEAALNKANEALTAANTERIAANTAASEADAKITAATAEGEAKIAAANLVLEKYKLAVTGIVDDITKDLTDEAKELDPGEAADPVDRLKWAKSMQALINKMTQGQGVPGASSKPQPKPQGEVAKTVVPQMNVKRAF